ncbi:Protein FAR-RED IMPAIRED RESPONSE 1, partial [Bienertia sinuspersici]
FVPLSIKLVLMYILYADMWPDNISAGKKCVCVQHSVDSRNVENNTNEEPCQDESHLDGGISLSNDNDVIPSNNEIRDTATDVIEKRHATPEVGMTFDSFEAVDEFYSAFGKAMGFGVNLGGHKKDAITNEKKYQYWHCECGPLKTKKKNNIKGERIESPVGTSRRRKKSKKCGCGVGMAAFLNKDGLWQIHKVELTHTNHAPSPCKSRYVPTFRDVPKFVIRIVKDLIDAGVKQSQIYHALANQLNGFENIPFLLKDMHNAVQKDRCKGFDEQDCHSMFQYFAKMKEANEDFFYSWTVDEANKLKDVVWVDARSRAIYRDFGDVVCFDATYITNRYELPFANFVGVNQHGQSILLGCALIRHEDSETYKWVMRQWLECMGDVQPGGIITDQKFQKHMKDVVYDSLTPEEFEGRWIILIQSFKLEGNEWLNGLWEDRRRWVPAYVKDVFWAGISTTQRVESIHHFFKGFMNAKTTLRNFVQKYTRALDHRANAEKVATANDDRRKARVKSTSIVEKHFQKVYTDAKFREVQHECFSLMYCLPKGETQLTEHVTEYNIEDRIQVGDPVHHVSKELKVVLDREKGELRCTCRLFEHRGILCRHYIRVMEMTNMPSVPEKHVLQRWRKDIKRKHLDIKVGFNDPDKTAEEIRYGVLQYEYEKVFQLAASSPEMCDHTISKAHELVQELEELHRGSSSTKTRNDGIPSSQASAGNLEDGPMVGEGVQNPPVGKRIGRPPVKTPYAYPKQKKTKGSSNSKESIEGSVNMPPQITIIYNPKGSQGSSTPLIVCNDVHHNDYQVPIPFHNDQVQLQSNSASLAHEYSHGHFSEIYPSWEMGLHNGTQGSISNLLARGMTGNAFPSRASFPTIGAPFFTQQMLSSASSYNMSSGARPPIRPSTSSSLPPRPH